MKILNYQDYELCIDITNEFINNLNESTNNNSIDIRPLIKTLNMNEELYGVFNDLLNQLIPFTIALSTNSKNETEVSTLLTLGGLMVFYLEERKLNNVDIIPGYTTDDAFRDDIKNILEELKMSGNGNGTVKKFSECISIVSGIIGLVYGVESEASIFTVVNPENMGRIINSITSIIINHNMNCDQFIQNFTIVNQGLSSRIGLDALREIFNNLGIEKQVGDNENTIDITNDYTHLGEIIVEQK